MASSYSVPEEKPDNKYESIYVITVIFAAVAVPITSLIFMFKTASIVNLIPFITGIIGGCAIYFIMIWSKFVNDGGQAFNNDIICQHTDIVNFSKKITNFATSLPGINSNNIDLGKLFITIGLVLVSIILLIGLLISIEIIKSSINFREKEDIFFFFAGFISMALIFLTMKTLDYNKLDYLNVYKTISWCPIDTAQDYTTMS